MIKLLELKRAIVEKRGLMRGMDFDLEVSNAQTNEQYTDDDMMIPKNTAVVVRRVPASGGAPGLLARLDGSATGRLHGGARPIEVPVREMPTDPRRRPQQQQQQQHAPQHDEPAANKTWEATRVPATAPDDTAAVLANVMGAVDEFRPRGPSNKRQLPRGQQPPRGQQLPSSYVCHRCGKPGHFIRDCPENAAGPNGGGRQQHQGVAGVPRVFWKPAGGDLKDGEQPKYDGIQPSTSRFETLVKRGVGSAPDDAARVREAASADKPPNHLVCPVCTKLFLDAVVLPCCGEAACDDCARTALMATGECPLCQRHVTADQLIPNKRLRAAVDKHLVDWVELDRRRRIDQAALENAAAAASSSIAGLPTDKQGAPDAVLDLGGHSSSLDEAKSADEQRWIRQSSFGAGAEDDFGGDVFSPQPKQESAPAAAGATEISSTDDLRAANALAAAADQPPPRPPDDAYRALPPPPPPRPIPLGPAPPYGLYPPPYYDYRGPPRPPYAHQPPWPVEPPGMPRIAYQPRPPVWGPPEHPPPPMDRRRDDYDRYDPAPPDRRRDDYDRYAPPPRRRRDDDTWSERSTNESNKRRRPMAQLRENDDEENSNNYGILDKVVTYDRFLEIWRAESRKQLSPRYNHHQKFRRQDNGDDEDDDNDDGRSTKKRRPRDDDFGDDGTPVKTSRRAADDRRDDARRDDHRDDVRRDDDDDADRRRPRRRYRDDEDLDRRTSADHGNEIRIGCHKPSPPRDDNVEGPLADNDMPDAGDDDDRRGDLDEIGRDDARRIREDDTDMDYDDRRRNEDEFGGEDDDRRPDDDDGGREDDRHRGEDDLGLDEDDRRNEDDTGLDDVDRRSEDDVGLNDEEGRDINDIVPDEEYDEDGDRGVERVAQYNDDDVAPDDAVPDADDAIQDYE